MHITLYNYDLLTKKIKRNKKKKSTKNKMNNINLYVLAIDFILSSLSKPYFSEIEALQQIDKYLLCNLTTAKITETFFYCLKFSGINRKLELTKLLGNNRFLMTYYCYNIKLLHVKYASYVNVSHFT